MHAVQHKCLNIFVSCLMVKKTHYYNITGNEKNTFIKKGSQHEWYITAIFPHFNNPIIFYGWQIHQKSLLHEENLMSNISPCLWQKPLPNYFSGAYVCVFTEIHQVPKDAHWLVEEQLVFIEELYSMQLVNFVHKKPTLKSVHPANATCIWLKWTKKSLKHRWKTCLKITLEKVWKSLTIWFQFINTNVHYSIIY